MALRFVKVRDLPLGKRTLRYGDQGNAVRRLQELLRQAGFYFGEVDGVFGVLTEEAVIMFQKSFHLKVDGCVGREALQALDNSSKRTGRIIYTVKPHENLNIISQKFQVRNSAWEGIAGQGNPQRKVYSGMRLLLYEKALFVWEKKGQESDELLITGQIRDLQMTADGELIMEGEDPENGCYVLQATADLWEQILSDRRRWNLLSQSLRHKKISKLGIDLQDIPPEMIFRWGDLLKYIRTNFGLIYCLVLPLPLRVSNDFRNQLYWMNLPIIAKTCQWIMVSPVIDVTTPEMARDSACALESMLKNVLRLGLSSRTMLLGRVVAWEWRQDQPSFRELSYREARLIRGMNPRNVQSWTDARLTQVNYSRHQQPYTLIYRDEQNWSEYLRLAVKYNFRGVTIQNFKQLGKNGNDLVTEIFAIIPGSKMDALF